MKNLLFVILVIVLNIFTTVSGEEFSPGQKIYVYSASEDAVGEKLVYYFKEELRNSKGITLGTASDSVFFISVITMDHDEDKLRTVYSIVWAVSTLTINAQLTKSVLDHIVGVCGTNRVKNCAESIVAHTDKLVSEHQKTWSK
jgi:hypothetical protein